MEEMSIEKERYLSAVLQVVLKYIYAGKEKEGWAFYDRTYKPSDKDKIRRDAQKALKGDVIYRSIYKARAK